MVIATQEQIKELEKLATPLVKYINDNFHPNMVITVENGSASLHETKTRIPIEQFID